MSLSRETYFLKKEKKKQALLYSSTSFNGIKVAWYR